MGSILASFLRKFENIRRDPLSFFQAVFPIVRWLPQYKVSDIRYDVIAGFTVGMTLLPIAMAYAQLAGVRTEFGLYSSFIGPIIYLFLGTSKDAVISPCAIGSMLVGQFTAPSPIANTGDNTYASAIAFFGGFFFLAIGISRLGFISSLFSIPVVSGFTSAAFFQIAAGQLKALFGLSQAKNLPHVDSPGAFIKYIQNIANNTDQMLPWDIAIGFSCLGFLLLMQYGNVFLVKVVLPKIPVPKTPRGKRAREVTLEVWRLIVSCRNAIVCVVSTGIVYGLWLSHGTGLEKQISMIGYIKPGMPTMTAPLFQLLNKTNNGSLVLVNGTTVVLQTASEMLTSLIPAFIIVPLMGILETFAILKALGRKNGYRIDPTHELITIGLVNLLNSFVGGYSISSATAVTALNDQSRVKTQFGAVIAAIMMIIALICVTPVFYFVPKAMLAAILIAATHNLVDVQTVIHMYKEYPWDLLNFFLTFILCVFFDLAYGVIIGLFVNMFTFIGPVVSAKLYVRSEPLEISGDDGTVFESSSGKITIIQLSHGMRYPSADMFIDRMTRILMTNDVHLVVDCRFVSGVDFTGLQAWRMFLQLAYRRQKHVIFANLVDSVRKKLETIGLTDLKYVTNIDDAIDEYNFTNQKPRLPLKLHELPDIAEEGDASMPPNIFPMKRAFSIMSSTGGIETPPAVEEIHRDQNSTIETGKGGSQPTPEVWAAHQAEILRRLSYQPHIYQDIPMTVGNIGTNDEIDAYGNGSYQDNENPVDAVEFATYPVPQFMRRTSHASRVIRAIIEPGQTSTNEPVTTEHGEDVQVLPPDGVRRRFPQTPSMHKIVPHLYSRRQSSGSILSGKMQSMATQTVDSEFEGNMTEDNGEMTSSLAELNTNQPNTGAPNE